MVQQLNGRELVPANLGGPLTAEEQMLSRAVTNALLSRDALLNSSGILDGPDRNLNRDAGYPNTISTEQYRTMYDRESIAARVVNVFPDECFALDPIVRENEEREETDFEKAWNGLNESRDLIHYLHRIDRISGIGHFGIMVLGIEGTGGLDTPVKGMPKDHEEFNDDFAPQQRQLSYIRTYDESLVKISRYEENSSSPRFGMPLEYDVTTLDPKNKPTHGVGMSLESRKVHWHRVIHVADNRESSEIFGAPRQRAVYNRLHDIRKVLGGGSEMFWKGGFPGYSFEMPKELVQLGGAIDEAKVKKQIRAYYDGTERYFTLKGLTAKSLAPQVASPKDHVYSLLVSVCIAMGVPMRVFTGSEEAKLSSTQDAITWNKRLHRRQIKYITPMLIKPFVHRLVMLGVLPRPSNLMVTWPDLNTSTDIDKAEVAERLTKAMAMYVEAGLSQMIHPIDYFVNVVGLTIKQAELIFNKAQKEQIKLELSISSTGEEPADEV